MSDNKIEIAIESKDIKLDQFLKWVNIVSSGGQAKHLITEGYVKVNGEKETRRSRKLIKGDVIELEGGKTYKVI